MNAKKLIAVVAMLAATGSVFAQSQESVAPDAHFVSTKTRTQVATELQQAYTQGALATRDGADAVSVASAPRSRAEVRSEVTQSSLVNQSKLGSIYFGG